MLFFKPRAGRGQIRGVDERHGWFGEGQLFQEGLQQLRIDLAQPHDAHLFAKGMEHSHVGHVGLVGQMRKATPGLLFRQQADQEIQGMHRCDQGQ